MIMGKAYVYAVARIRALEKTLFSDAVIRRLMACQTYEQCLLFLEEKGWGDGTAGQNIEEMLTEEEAKIWKIMKELDVPKEMMDIMNAPVRFHNLKAAVKAVYTGETGRTIFYEDAEKSGEELIRIIEERDYQRLPKGMRESGQEAFEALLHTGDGQVCDMIIDKAALEWIREAGAEACEVCLRDYAECVVALADIKIVVRAQRMKKSVEFMKRFTAECGSLSVKRLAEAASGGATEISSYLRQTPYADGAESLMQSMASFERWCDERMIHMIFRQKYETFGIGPVMAYVIARQNEIKTVRIILTGKYNHLSEQFISERIRKMYGQHCSDR